MDIDHEGIYVIPKEGVYEEFVNEKDIYMKNLIEEIKETENIVL